MNSRGFTLVEMIVVMAIIAVLASIATLNWNRMTVKTTVEGQIRAVHAEMMRLRLEALYGKRERMVEFVGKTFNIYSSEVKTSSPLEVKTFKYPFDKDIDFTFNTSGMASGSKGSVCVNPYGSLSVDNDASVDSLVISAGRISLGKRTTGGACVSNDITKR